MSISGGGLSFSIEIDDEKALKALRETEARIRGLTDTARRQGAELDEVFKRTEEGLRILSQGVRDGGGGLDGAFRGAERGVRDLGQATREEGVGMSSTFKQVGASIATAFTIGQAGLFAQQVVQVRREIESLEISFRTLLGSEEKASALFGELRDFAVNTPMDLGDLAKGAQTLLGFNVEAERVMPTLKAIGDISMGSAERFGSLTLAFAQTASTGKLMGQDLLQMINAGFNPLTIISEQTGKSIAQLKEEMSQGAISAEMVSRAFEYATAKGGKFHGMLEKQSKGLAGSMAQLRGAVENMYNEIGQNSQGVITMAVQGLSLLVKHYKTLGEVLAVLITTYGAYKTALMAQAVVQNIVSAPLKAVAVAKAELTMREASLALARQEVASAMATGNAKAIEAAQRQFNIAKIAKETATRQLATATATAETARTNILVAAKVRLMQVTRALQASMMANPYLLVASAVVALGYAIYKLVTAETAAEEAHRRHTEALERQREAKDKLQGRTSELISILKDETQTVQAQAKAWRELEESLPKLGMTREEFLSLPEEEQKRVINLQIELRGKEEAQAELQKLKDDLQSLYEQERLNAYNGSTVSVSREIEETRELIRLKEEEIRKNEELRKQAEYDALPLEKKIEHHEKIATALEEERSRLEAIVEQEKEARDKAEGVAGALFSWLDPLSANAERLAIVNHQLQQTQKTVQGLQAQRSNAPTLKDDLEKALKDWKGAEKKFAEINQNKDKHTSQEYRQAKEEAEKAKKAYQDLGGIVEKAKTGKATKKGKSEAERRAEALERQQAIDKQNEEMARRAKAGELEIEQARLEGMQEGWEKQYRQIELNFRRREQANKERERAMVEELRRLRQLEWEQANPNAKKEGKVFDPTQYTAADLSKEQKAQLEEYNRLNAEARLQAERQIASSILKEYGSFEDKRNQIAERYAKERARIQANAHLDETQKQSALKGVDRREAQDLKAANREEAEALMRDGGLLAEIFQNATELSTREIHRLADEATTLFQLLKSGANDDYLIEHFGLSPSAIESIRQSPEQLKALGEQAKRLNDQSAKLNPFRAFIRDLKALGDDNSTEKMEVRLKRLGASTAQCAGIIGGFAGKLKEMAEASGDQGMSESMEDVQGAMDAVGNVAQGFAQGGLIGGIAAAAGTLMDFAVSAMKAGAEHRKALEAIERSMTAQRRHYELVKLTRELEGARFGGVLGSDEYGKAINAIGVYHTAVRKLKEEIKGSGKTLVRFGLFRFGEIDDALAGLRKIQIITGHKKGGFLRKGRDLYGSVLGRFPELIDSAGKFNAEVAKSVLETQRFSDGSKEALQNLINLYEKQEEAMKQARDYLSGIFGELGGTMTDALVDAFRSGSNAAEAFSQSVTNMLEKMAKQMVYSVTIAPLMQEAQEEMMAVMKQGGQMKASEQFARYTEIMTRMQRGILRERDQAERLMQELEKSAKAEGLELFKGVDEASKSKGLSGAIKNASQESIDLLAGQTNAVRINQVQGLELSRSQLASLVSIDAKIGISNQLLERIQQGVNARPSSPSDSLRAVGITRGVASA